MQRPIRSLGAYVLAVVAGVTLAGALAGAEPPKATGAVPDLSGEWMLNRRLSEDARQKVRESLQRQQDKSIQQRGRTQPLLPTDPDEAAGETMEALLEPAEELSVRQTSTEIVFDEKFARRRTLRFDGRKRKADNGLSEVACEWKDGRLVVETRDKGGRRTTETWELSAAGSRLTATTRLAGVPGGTVTFTRTYDRARI